MTICLGVNGEESQLIFNHEDMKSRLIKKDTNWFIAEYKTPTMETWFPWIAVTKDFLNLSANEITWSK